MINVDASEVSRSELLELRRQGIRVSNSNTRDKICVSCYARRVADWYDNNDYDDDFGVRALGSIGGFFGGNNGGGISGGGFGGFGGGSFSGGGGSGSW